MKLNDVKEEYAVYGMLFSLSNRIQTIGDKEFADITLKQHFLMVVLMMFEQPPMLKEAGVLMGCSYQNVKRMAEHLKKEGYLKIQQDPEDKRKLRLLPTEKVKQLGEQSMEQSKVFMEHLFHDIPAEDLKVTYQTLKKMDQNIGGVIE